MAGRKKHGPRRKAPPPAGVPGVTPETACDALEPLLSGDARARILDAAQPELSFTVALVRLRDAFRAHRFPVPGGELDLEEQVRELDRRTRREGFRVLQAWDHKAQRFTPDDVPVMLLEYYDYLRQGRGVGRASPAILLDFHLLHLLALVAMRAWDSPTPHRVMERVQHLLDLLQGPGGSGHRFVDSPWTLLILAVSHFHPRDAAYDQLIERLRGLPEDQRVAFARVSAGVLAAHLRWGLSQMYEWDVPRMRVDNVGDYPWLLFTVATLMEAFDGMEASDPQREVVGADLLNALTADPDAFAGEPPEAFLPHLEEYGRFREGFQRNAAALGELFQRLRPTRDRYSPLGFHFNFPHNVVVAGTTLALLDQAPGALSLDDLLLTRPQDIPGAGDPVPGEGAMEEKGGEGEGGPALRKSLARALMLYAGARPERLEARGARLILLDAHAGERIVEGTLKRLFTS